MANSTAETLATWTIPFNFNAFFLSRFEQKFQQSLFIVGNLLNYYNAPNRKLQKAKKKVMTEKYTCPRRFIVRAYLI